MDAWQERVVQEKAELDEKINKLEQFFSTETYARLSNKHLDLFDKQIVAMRQYSEALEGRIELF